MDELDVGLRDVRETCVNCRSVFFRGEIFMTVPAVPAKQFQPCLFVLNHPALTDLSREASGSCRDCVRACSKAGNG